MGIYSTVTIDRSYATVRIMQLLATATNEELSNALFALVCDPDSPNFTRNNYIVLNDDEYTQYLKQDRDNRY